MQWGDTFIQLRQYTPFDTTVNCHSLSATDSLIDSAQDRLTFRDQLSQSLDSSWTDSSDHSLDSSLPELLIEMEPIHLMNQLLTQLTMEPSTKIHPTPFTDTAINNILDWL